MDEKDNKAAPGASIPLTQGPLEPTEQQLQVLLSGAQEGPYHFINLLRFREHAEYPPEHPAAVSGLSGAEAYNLYGAVALEHVTRRGGRLVTLNAVEQQLIGAGGNWHQVATMEYRHVDAFIDMVSDPDYQAALVHRDAGLEATEVYVTRPLIKAPIG